MVETERAIPASWIERAEDVEASAAKKVHVLLRDEGAGIYRVQCMSCHEIFDVFGTLEGGTLGPDQELSVVPQRCLEHLSACAKRSGTLAGTEQLREVNILQNANSPTLFKFEAMWR